jgi:DNA-binding SARP family transcriptional activator
MPFELAFRLSGPLSGYRGGLPYRLNIAGTTRVLLAYLLAHPDAPQAKEHLGDLLWPCTSETKRRSALNSAVHRLRKALHGLPATLHCGNEAIVLTLAPGSVVDADILRFHVERADRGLDAAAAQGLGAILETTQRPFLEGIDGAWAVTLRERLFDLRIRGLAHLMRWHASERRYECALAAGREIVAEDPLRETIQCEVMWLYVLNGERARALRQFDELETRLREELSISPMEETRALHDHIRFGLERALPGARPIPDRFAAVEDERRAVYATLSERPGSWA